MRILGTLTAFSLTSALCVAQTPEEKPAGARATDPIPGMESESLGAGLYAHEPMYIIAGGHPKTDIKFQVSFKARLFWQAYMGYTQLNDWKISDESAPFKDTTHRFSLFYYQTRAERQDGYRLHWSGGYEHNSNGKDGAASRSVDMLYVRPMITLGPEDGRHWRATAKVFGFFNKGRNNQDIDDFRRNVELSVGYLNHKTASVSATTRLAAGGFKTWQLDFTQPLRTAPLFKWDVPGSVYLQLFSGFGENMLDYNRKTTGQFRIGYSLERGR